MATLVEGDPKATFSILQRGVGEDATPLPGLLHFTLDSYLIMLSDKQGGIKYHFLSLWYDSTRDRTIGEHSTLGPKQLFISIQLFSEQAHCYLVTMICREQLFSAVSEHQSEFVN